VRVGQQSRLTLTALDASGAVLDVGSITWATSDARIAILNGNGNVRGVAVGTATITATVAGRSATATVRVTAN
jgi:alpha-amylase